MGGELYENLLNGRSRRDQVETSKAQSHKTVTSLHLLVVLLGIGLPRQSRSRPSPPLTCRAPVGYPLVPLVISSPSGKLPVVRPGPSLSSLPGRIRQAPFSSPCTSSQALILSRASTPCPIKTRKSSSLLVVSHCRPGCTRAESVSVVLGSIISCGYGNLPGRDQQWLPLYALPF